MAHALGLETVAEGIETKGQADALAELGCGLAQGFFFGAPTDGVGTQRTDVHANGRGVLLGDRP
jgi:EAL domain-containing protein (putative c-di-GMP-specific phosphodiesterase class I)